MSAPRSMSSHLLLKSLFRKYEIQHNVSTTPMRSELYSLSAPVIYVACWNALIAFRIDSIHFHFHPLCTRTKNWLPFAPPYAIIGANDYGYKVLYILVLIHSLCWATTLVHTPTNIDDS